MNEENVSLEDVLELVKKRIKIIIIIPLITLVFAIIINCFYLKPQYSMSTKLFVGNGIIQGERYDNSQVDMYQKLMKTYIEIARSSDLIEKALEYRGIDANASAVAAALSVDQLVDTQIIEITYVSSENIISPIILDAVVEEFMKESQELIPNGDVYVMEKVKAPEKPSGPNKKMNIILMEVISIMVSVSIVLLLGYMDKSVRKKEQLERIFNAPVLGSIPKE